MNDFDLDDLDGEEDEDSGGWLVSYADMMTLIACFFILMMAFANYDPVGFNIKAEKLSKSFRKDKYKSSETQLSKMTEEIARHELKDRLKISLKDSELVVKFSSRLIFQNGKSELSNETLKTLDALIDIVKTTNPNYRILVEGHSDDDFDKRKGNNWSLSSARAASVAQRFEYFGFPPQMIVPIGRGNSDPLFELKAGDKKNIDKRKLNRRVVIRLLEPIKKKKMKFGLGVYFKDALENVDDDRLKRVDSDDMEIKGGL